MTITVFGSVNLDLTVSVSHMPVPGETSHARAYDTGLGGKGANQAVAATRLARQPVRFAAAIGVDGFGQRVREDLAACGVETDHLTAFDGLDTGIALIHVDATSQNTITVVGGANMAWPDEGPDVAVFEGAKVALFQLETPLAATLSAMRSARKAGATVILDPAPIPSEGVDALLREADIVTPNETEAAALAGTEPSCLDEAIAVAKSLCARGPNIAVIKLGSRGLAYATADGKTGTIAPFSVTAVDTVAAGDSFNGALAVALAEGQALEDALRFASAAGALATTRRGASSAVPHREEVDELVSQAK